MSEAFIKSYNRYSHRFVVDGKSIVIPSKFEKPNVVSVGEDFEALLKIAEFKVLIDTKQGGFRKLDKMPRDAMDTLERIALANDQANKAFAERDTAIADKARIEAELERLKTEAANDGFDVPEEVKKAREETEKANEEVEALKAELAALKAKKAPKKDSDVETSK